MSPELDPSSVLILKFRRRSVAVPSGHCLQYDNLVETARRSLRSLHTVPPEDLVFQATIPGHSERSQVEISKELWPTVRTSIRVVTTVLESAASPMASGLFPDNDLAAAAIDQPVLLLFLNQRCRTWERGLRGSTTMTPFNLVRPAIHVVTSET